MSIEAARELISAAEVVASFSGSGLSRESGIHTFRDDDGIWTKVDPMKMASIEGFLADPEGVTEWYDGRRTFIAGAEPNEAHRALAGSTGMIHITQNIDRLLEKAGASRVVHLHGHIDGDHCLEECGYSEEVDPLNPRGLRTCENCGALMRPSIVLFGEMLPEQEWMRAHMAVVAADVLLVIGTSAEVYPAAGLIALARDHGAKVIVVNTQPSAASGIATIELIGQAGDILPELLA